jgi:hypothetical protein
MDDYELFKQRMAALSGAIFLFGLAALFLADAIFPAILVLILITAIPALIAEQGWRYGLWILLQMAIWLGGMPLLFTADMIFPGVLVLAGMSALLVAIAPPDQLDKQHQAWVQERRSGGQGKRKRKRDWQDFPVPPVDDEIPGEAVYDDEIEDDIIQSAASGRSDRRRM